MIRRIVRMVRRSRARNCAHDEEHATWYERWADHAAGTVRIEYDCGLCHKMVLLRVDRLGDGERDWNDKLSLIMKAFPDASGSEVFDMFKRTLGPAS